MHTTQSLFVDDLCFENCPWIVIGPCSAVLLIDVAIDIEMGLIAKEDLVKIWYLLVFACVSNRKMFGTLNCVSWILYACNDKSFAISFSKWFWTSLVAVLYENCLDSRPHPPLWQQCFRLNVFCGHICPLYICHRSSFFEFLPNFSKSSLCWLIMWV